MGTMQSNSSQDEQSEKSPVVCVFCGSSPGKKPVHLESARALAHSLSKAGYKLVYGGGTMGIMGEVSKTMVSLSGPESVRGIIPRALIRTEVDTSTRGETSQTGSRKAERTMSAQELQRIDSNEDPESEIIPANEFGATTVVPDMHTRKRMMAQCVEAGGPGSGFVALAGGYGTLEEVMEMVTWNQLGIHTLPIVLVNIDGYWTGLLDWVKKSIREGFVGEGAASILVEVNSADDVVDALRDYKLAPGRYKLDWTK
ncbi:LOG family protein [Exophiala dermatitidis]